MDTQPRVVSFLPSATEIICAIKGGRELLVGRCDEDDYPAEITALPPVIFQTTKFTTSADVDRQVRSQMAKTGSLYTVDKDRLCSLRPDVILTQDLCKVCSIDLVTADRIAKEMQPSPRVVNLSPTCLEDVFADVLEVGRAVGLERAAAGLCESLRTRFARVQSAVARAEATPKVVFLDWIDPFVVGGHWVPQLIEMAHGEPLLNPVFEDDRGRRHAGRARAVTPEMVAGARADVIVVSACGLDVSTACREIAALEDREYWREIRRAGPRVVVTNGEYSFNRPGPRLVESFEFLAAFIHDIPELLPEGFEYRVL